MIFEKVNYLGMNQADYVWIVSEQVLRAARRPDGILSVLLKKSEERFMITDSVSVLSSALRQMHRTVNLTTPPISCKSSNKWNIGKHFYDILLNQTFDGSSGRITFDESGDRLYSEYEILNTVNGTEHTVGKYSFDMAEMKMKLNLHTHRIIWPGNTSQKPLGIFVPKHLRVTTLAEKPFVWAKKIGAHEQCSKNQIICPKYNNTQSREYGFYEDGPKEKYCCEGYCIDLLKELAVRLNFSYQLELVPDGQYGSLEFVDGYDKPRRWTGLVGQLVYKQVDMVVAPLTANPERLVTFIDHH